MSLIKEKTNTSLITYNDIKLKPLADMLNDEPEKKTMGQIMSCVEKIVESVSMEKRYRLISEADQMIQDCCFNILLTIKN